MGLDIFNTVEFDEDQAAYADQVREILQEAYDRVMEILPDPTRETALFTTNMQQAGMWAQRSIAVNDIP